MLRHFVIVCLLLVILPYSILAAADTPPGVVPVTNSLSSSAEIDKANKYLAAEVSRQIADSQAKSLQEMKNYNDENFQIFDGRMSELVSDMKMKFVIGGLGVVFLAMGLGTYLMMKQLKRYSYETYLEQVIEKQMLVGKPVDQPQYTEAEQQGMQQMRQQEWHPQQSQQTIGMDMGQQWASEQTAMNQWQAQPAYDGSWKAPIETVPQYKEEWMQEHNFPAPKEQGRGTQEYSDDPMNSPDMRGNYYG